MSAAAGRELAAGAGLDELRGIGRSGVVSAQADDWPNTSRLLPWGVALFLVMIWLIPFDSVSLPISLPLDATPDRPLLVGLFLLFVLEALRTSDAPARRATPIHWALGLFALIAITSILLNTQTLAALGELDPALKKLSLLFTYGLFFVVASSAIRPPEVPSFIKLMLALATVTAVGVLVEYRLGYNAFYTWTGAVLPGTTPPPGTGRFDSIGRLTIVGPGSHPLAPATMLAVAMPFAIVGLLGARGRRSKAAYAVASALMLAAAMATQRKTSLVLPVACLVVLLAYRPRALVKLVPLGVALLLAIHVVAPGAIGGVVDQLKPSALTGVLTTKDRVSDYDAIRPEIANHPLLGRGYESYDQHKYRILDNQYLTLAVGVGLLGVLAYLAIFGAAFVAAHRNARSRDPGAAATGMAAAAAIVSMVIGSALLDVLALPQLPYLFCIVAAFIVVMTRGRLERSASRDAGSETPQVAAPARR